MTDLLVEVLLARQVVDGRVDAATQILKNHDGGWAVKALRLWWVWVVVGGEVSDGQMLKLACQRRCGGGAWTLTLALAVGGQSRLRDGRTNSHCKLPVGV